MDSVGIEQGVISDLDSRYQALVRTASEAKDRAYCPYSKFRVGAALMIGDDIVYSGCNVENASYGLTVCAERVAIFKAVSEGHTDFTAIAVASDVKEYFVTPCGACRQVLAEFGHDYDVFIVKPDLSWMRISVSQLLPFAFNHDALEKLRVCPKVSK